MRSLLACCAAALTGCATDAPTPSPAGDPGPPCPGDCDWAERYDGPCGCVELDGEVLQPMAHPDLQIDGTLVSFVDGLDGTGAQCGGCFEIESELTIETVAGGTYRVAMRHQGSAPLDALVGSVVTVLGSESPQYGIIHAPLFDLDVRDDAGELLVAINSAAYYFGVCPGTFPHDPVEVCVNGILIGDTDRMCGRAQIQAMRLIWGDESTDVWTGASGALERNGTTYRLFAHNNVRHLEMHCEDAAGVYYGYTLVREE